jgi:hypothetical protein
MAMVKEADKRGIKIDKNVSNLNELKVWAGDNWGYSVTEWSKDAFVMNRLTTSHKANLYTKDPIYYFEFFSSLEDSNPCCPERREPCKYYWVAHDPLFKEDHEITKVYAMAS